jgi:hypothetical protein
MPLTFKKILKNSKYFTQYFFINLPMKQLVTVAFIVLGIQSLLAQDLVYKPNPLLVGLTL